MTRNRATGVRTSAAIRVGKITASEIWVSLRPWF